MTLWPFLQDGDVKKGLIFAIEVCAKRLCEDERCARFVVDGGQLYGQMGRAIANIVRWARKESPSFFPPESVTSLNIDRKAKPAGRTYETFPDISPKFDLLSRGA